MNHLDDMPQPYFGRRVMAAIVAAELSIVDTANKTGINYRTLYRICKELREPLAVEIELLSKALGLGIGELYGEGETRES